MTLAAPPAARLRRSTALAPARPTGGPRRSSCCALAPPALAPPAQVPPARIRLARLHVAEPSRLSQQQCPTQPRKCDRQRECYRRDPQLQPQLHPQPQPQHLQPQPQPHLHLHPHRQPHLQPPPQQQQQRLPPDRQNHASACARRQPPQRRNLHGHAARSWQRIAVQLPRARSHHRCAWRWRAATRTMRASGRASGRSARWWRTTATRATCASHRTASCVAVCRGG
jgi:hypothetical protein